MCIVQTNWRAGSKNSFQVINENLSQCSLSHSAVDIQQWLQTQERRRRFQALCILSLQMLQLKSLFRDQLLSSLNQRKLEWRNAAVSNERECFFKTHNPEHWAEEVYLRFLYVRGNKKESKKGWKSIRLPENKAHVAEKHFPHPDANLKKNTFRITIIADFSSFRWAVLWSVTQKANKKFTYKLNDKTVIKETNMCIW